jgi:lysophospholipase L1-like esterase
MKRISLFLTFLVASACGVITNPMAPADPAAASAVVYSAVGASDANGVGGSVPCLPYVTCPDGTGYVQVVARKYKTAGKDVTLQNLGVPGAVLSKTFQDMGNQLNYGILVNFLSDEMPFVKTDATLVTVFAGANDANTIGAAVKAGFGGSDPTAWVNAQITTFGKDMLTLVAGIKARAPKARIVILNLPNLAALPYSDGRSVGEKQVLQSIAVALNEKINAMTSQGATVVDMMCDSRIYSRSIFSSDGFHPNDSGYALFADLVYTAASSPSPATPKASCTLMSQF